MLSYASTAIAFAAVASAWMPGERNMTAPDGNSLFESPHKPNGTHWHNGTTGHWLPGTLPIRGVNLGSEFIIEPWMASTEWSNVGCSSSEPSEFDCVNKLGQATANANFANHWGSFITQDDINKMSEYGLNTIRIPVGYWVFESLKYDSEHFPEGQMPYIANICGWAADKGMYVIIDLHGAPFGQTAQNSFTGQMTATIDDSNPAFYQESQYERAYSFLDQMTRYIHNNGGTTGQMRNVGMIEVLNEPSTSIPDDLKTSLRQTYYPGAWNAIRSAESDLGITANNYLHIQFMNTKWGVGDPHQYLTDDYFAAYDDHRYLKWDTSVTTTQDGYISASCADDRGGNAPTIVGEWSLSVADAVEKSADFWPVESQLDFYKRWFGAQVQAYEKQDGWIFWSWKSQLGDSRWSYVDAVAAGAIPTDLNSVVNPC